MNAFVFLCQLLTCASTLENPYFQLTTCKFNINSLQLNSLMYPLYLLIFVSTRTTTSISLTGLAFALLALAGYLIMYVIEANPFSLEIDVHTQLF